MAETIRLELYRCNQCGNIIEIYHAGRQNLSCCGKRMEKLKENTSEASKVIHIPVITKLDTGFKIQVGENEHPMSEEHHIRWIELITDHTTFTRFLLPGSKPEAIFYTQAMKITVKTYCNLHGLWKNEN
jgi:superoxide reductase